ncbi:MAG: Spy0128 family protein [Anaerococcus sp.]
MKRIRRNISLVLALTMILQVIMPVVVLADNSVQDNSREVLEEGNEVVEEISETTQVEETVLELEPEDPPIETEEVELEDSQEDPEPVDPEKPENSTPGEDDNSSSEGSEGSDNNLEDSGDTDSEDAEDQDDEDETEVVNDDKGEENLYQPFAELDNLVTSFEFSYNDKSGSDWIKVEDGQDLEVDINDLNAVQMKYGLTKPNGMKIEAGDTYTIDLPLIYGGIGVENQSINIGETQVATYSIVDGQVIITFNENANNFDNVEMSVNLSGSFNTEIFETEEEVVVKVPYRDESSYRVTIRPEQQAYDGTDKKEAGSPYILNEYGSKTTTDRNPTHIDWTVRVNDSMGSFTNATVIDDLGENLEIVEDSFVVERIIRNYNNEETGRETVNATPEITSNGFELNLGDIEDAYDITYTTRIIRPDGGGTKKINNNAQIILDGNKNNVSDNFTGTWSGDIPTINKEGKLSDDDPHIIDWTVEYNYGKEDLGTVTLTDVLSHGQVDLDSLIVLEVDVDIDGNIIGQGTPVIITPVKTTNGMTLPNLDANGKAYYITFSSTVPVGLNEDITNTISDNLPQPNSDEASVPVNTIPTGGKVGEQKVDDEGKPYIEWTITMNSEKIDVGSITVRDVFNKDYLDFGVDDDSLYKLYKDEVEAENFTIAEYTHTDSREGFKLEISDAGPHEYKFVYRTYYTTLGMQQQELANHAELVFEDGDGIGIGDSVGVDFDLDGPKAGIDKSGRYVLNQNTGLQEIEWTIKFNKSKILLENPTITDAFTSGNYEFIADSLTMTENGQPFTEFVPKNTDNGFEVNINKDTNAVYEIKFRTTADDKSNEAQTNEATLKWQGGEETDNATVNKRDPGINKSGKVVINNDGTKTVNWTVNFNTKENVIHNFALVDEYTPTTVTVSNIKITSGEVDVTSDFTISSESTGGTFTVTKDKLDAKTYQLTYSTTLSPAEEQADIKNTANITYTGGKQSTSKTVSKPTLGVEKEANGINKEPEKPVISWTIQANTDSKNKHVNLVDAVLEDTIPADQRLIADSIKVYRTDNPEVEVAGLNINTNNNSFSINLPDGPYQYKVTFDTEILQMPSLDETDFDRYNNYTTLTNQTEDENLKQEAKDDAWIRYYADVTNDLTGKKGEQNPDTENIDYEVTINPEGLTINNPKVIDTLSKNHQYIEDTIKVKDVNGTELTSGYTLIVGEDNRSFTIEFDGGTISEPYKISYSTRLNANLIGTYQVTNDIVLTGGTEEKRLDSTQTTTSSQQWFYGGGGSGRVLDFGFNKETPNGSSLSGAKFTLERVDSNGTRTVVNDNITTAGNTINFNDYRAGRYILTETAAPEGYAQLNPIYFAVGYTETEGEYQITIMDSKWTSSSNPNARANGNILTVTNNYEKVTAQGFEANKTLTGLDLQAEQFEFELLDGSSNVVARAKNDADGNIVFPEQSFNEPGTYNFKIREVNGALGGITYDTRELNVQVIIGQGNNGLEVQEVKYLDGQEFENSYSPNSVNTVIEASKILKGQNLREGQFEFQLLDSDKEVIQTVENKSDGTITFEAINFDEVGEYDYFIREVEGNLGGITYDEREFKVTVSVTDDGEGQLHSAITKYVEGPVQFTNTYTAGPGKIVLEAEKILEGKVLGNDQFEFELVNEQNEVIQTVKNNANGQVIFNEIEYSEEGTYNYTIREKEGNLGGITYDQAQYPVKVTVVDGGEGILVPTANYDNGPAVFTNSYQAAPDSIVLEAKKILEGQELIAGQFTFTLTDESGEIIQTVTNNAEGQVIFDEITYDKTGIHTYIIKETRGDQGGVTYDTTSYTVVVRVTDDGEGNLVASANYIDGPAQFTNIYTPNPDSIVIKGNKLLEGQNLRNGQFTFELVDKDGEVLQTKSNNSDGQIIFDEITYEVRGEHKYTIREVKGTQGGITYDEAVYTVLVKVADDREGTLTAEVEYPDGTVEFKNTYQAAPDSIVLEATKILEGQILREDQFEFELLDKEENVLETVKNNSEGQIIFSEITYNSVGEYYYTIREVVGSQGGVTYDDRVIEVTVTVTDDGEGRLLATKEYTNGPAVFTNTYTPNPDSIVIEARKTLRGQSLRDSQFTFELRDSEGNLIQRGTNNRKGQIIFDEITYSEAGEYRYTLREIRGSQRRMTYDDKVYEILVRVTDDGVGTLTAEVEYIGVDELVFNNTYRPITPPTTPVDPEDPEDPKVPVVPEDPQDPTRPTRPGTPSRPSKGTTLPQTGMVWWPASILAISGITIFGLGLNSDKKKKRKNDE